MIHLGAIMSRFIPAALLAIQSGVFLTVLPTAAPAQQLASKVDEITVTARKREENLQTVPVAVSVFDNEQLQIRDIFNLERLADQTTPNKKTRHKPKPTRH